jgi:ankyrin repeat protein
MAEAPSWQDLFRTAVRDGDVVTLRQAIAAGLPLNDHCLHGAYTPLHHLADRGAKAPLLAALLEAGADVDARVAERNQEGRTPAETGHTALMLAAKDGRTALVRLLLAAGADVHVAGSLGVTAITAASNGGVGRRAGASKSYTSVVRMLLDAGAKPDAQTLQYAAWGGNPDIVQMILDAGVDPNEEARLGLPLMWAFATKGDPPGKAEVLLRAGADPDRRATRGQLKGLTARDMGRHAGKAAEALLAAFPRKAPPTGG